jgi:urease accessory protein
MRRERAEAAHLRTRGSLHLSACRVGDRTAAARLRERGPLRLRFPRPTQERALEGVVINTAGGVVGGDRLEVGIEAGEGTSLVLTSQAAEKVYRSTGVAARAAIRLTVEAGARLAWIPQETILFDRARLSRTLDAEVAPDASLVLCEGIVFGRTAMGERVRSGALRDRWRLHRGGRLVFADALTLEGAIDDVLSHRAIAAGALAIATIVAVGPDVEERIEDLRAALEPADVEAGASVACGVLRARLLARDGLALRGGLVAALTALGVTLPRAFQL